MSKADEIIEEMKKTLDKLEDYKPIQKIKMKEEFYNNLAREVQQEVSITEVLDEKRQPLNRICEVKIEIDNDIKKDYEVVYMNKKIKMIELLNMIYKGELKDKQKFRVHFKNGLTRDIYYKKIYGKNISSLCNWYDNYTFQDEYDLDDEVEILEDNTEEIEELEYYCIGQEKSANLTKIIDKIEEIRVAINQIRKDLNNDK